jgi:hypothetical protein
MAYLGDWRSPTLPPPRDWIFEKTDMRDNILQGFAEVGRIRSPSTLDAPRRVAAFQRRPPVKVVRRVQTGVARGFAIERTAADPGLQTR